MGIIERRERDRRQVRRKILDAARGLFVAEGYEAVTMRRIAEAIEYSATAIYSHFEDKDTLFRELCREDSVALAQAFQAIAAESEPLARLRKIGMAYVDFGVEHPNHYRLMFMSSLKLDTADLPRMGHGNPEEDGYAFLVATVAEAMERGLLRPDLRDPHLVAQAFWAGGHGVVALHLAKRGDPWVDWRPLQETAALVMDAMIDGFKRQAPSCG
jgi:AcrR family transcriptional regulator